MSLSGAARVAGVIGWPIRHSRSPRLHGYWLDQYQIDGAYVPLAVAPAQLETALRGLAALGLRGVNVTVPHKEAAYRLVDHHDPGAERLGAVNTIVVSTDGSLVGSNTDGFGFLANLDQAAPGWRADSTPAAVIGAGGSARAVVAALQSAGVPAIRLINRTVDRAREVRDNLGGAIEVVSWSERDQALAGIGLVVNTTTQGMAGQPPLDLRLDQLPRSAIVTDIVYTPLETPLLAAARSRGHRTVDGLGMLLHQARPGFQAWFGVLPEVTPELRQMVLGPAAGAGDP